jgi:tripartite-type tricarboxylate transporter receptor subunit TctC
MASRPVIIDRGPDGGGEGEVASAALARKAHPDAAIVRFADSGEPFTEDAPRTTEAAVKASTESKAEKN